MLRSYPHASERSSSRWGLRAGGHRRRRSRRLCSCSAAGDACGSDPAARDGRHLSELATVLRKPSNHDDVRDVRDTAKRCGSARLGAREHPNAVARMLQASGPADGGTASIPAAGASSFSARRITAATQAVTFTGRSKPRLVAAMTSATNLPRPSSQLSGVGATARRRDAVRLREPDRVLGHLDAEPTASAGCTANAATLTLCERLGAGADV